MINMVDFLTLNDKISLDFVKISEKLQIFSRILRLHDCFSQKWACHRAPTGGVTPLHFHLFWAMNGDKKPQQTRLKNSAADVSQFFAPFKSEPQTLNDVILILT
jgi:hypothetical protein